MKIYETVFLFLGLNPGFFMELYKKMLYVDNPHLCLRPKKYCKTFDPNWNKSVICFENSKISGDTVSKMLPKVKSLNRE